MLGAYNSCLPSSVLPSRYVTVVRYPYPAVLPQRATAKVAFLATRCKPILMETVVVGRILRAGTFRRSAALVCAVLL